MPLGRNAENWYGDRMNVTLFQRDPVRKRCGVFLYIEKYLRARSHKLVENLWEEVREKTRNGIII